MKNFLKRLQSALIILLGGAVPTENKIGYDSRFGGTITSSSSELEENYLFDFARNWSGGFSGNFVDALPHGSDDSDEPKIKPSKKIKIKPVDVLEELEKIPTPFSLNLLEEKISILKDKAKLITQHYSKREVVALIERLENRKKYEANKSFFDRFNNTDQQKIDTLLSKYELVMKESDIFIPEFPDDAINVMKEYTEKVFELTGKKPLFSVIAEEKHFKKAYEKRDPILLAQSPFGFYYQILGAWDEEMILLTEL